MYANYRNIPESQRVLMGKKINKLIKTGILPPPTSYKCHLCGETAHDYHNLSYDFKDIVNDIVPLCRGCHLALHKVVNFGTEDKNIASGYKYFAKKSINIKDSILYKIVTEKEDPNYVITGKQKYTEDESIETIFGGVKVSILNKPKKGEYKYTIVTTKGLINNYNNKDKFTFDLLNLIAEV